MLDHDVTWHIISRLAPDAVVIGEVFAKKTPQTPKTVVEVRRKRFRAYDQVIEE